jgi:hypothetical protein
VSEDYNSVIATPHPALTKGVAGTGSLKRISFWRLYFGYFITLTQVFADFATVFLCYMASYWFYTAVLKGWSPQTLMGFTWLAIGAGVLYILMLDREGLYRREISLLNVKELRGIFYVGFYTALVILSLSFYVRSITLSRITFTIALTMTPLFLYLQRQVFYKLHVLFHQRGLSQRRVFIYGAGNIGTHLAKRLYGSPSLGLLPVGFLDDKESKKGQNLFCRSSSSSAFSMGSNIRSCRTPTKSSSSGSRCSRSGAFR